MCFNDADKQHQIWRISSWLHGVGWVLKIYWFQAGQQWLHTSTHRNSILSMNVVHKYFTTKSILYCMHTLKNLTSVCYASFAVYFMPCIFLILVLAFISQFFRFCSALLVPFFFFFFYPSRPISYSASYYFYSFFSTIIDYYYHHHHQRVCVVWLFRVRHSKRDPDINLRYSRHLRASHRRRRHYMGHRDSRVHLVRMIGFFHFYLFVCLFLVCF